MQDVKRAMRLLRSKAKELGVDTNRVGILGCSAGGHLASYLAAHPDPGMASSSDPVERQKTRPDFSVYIYPVITMDASFTHAGSRSALLGNNPTKALVDSLSHEKQVRADTPPTFLVHGTVDNVVPLKNSQVYYDSCAARKVPAKFHRVTDACGGHGFGYNCENWGEAGYSWLKSGGYLDATGPVSIAGGKAGIRLLARRPGVGSEEAVAFAGSEPALFSVAGERVGTLADGKVRPEIPAGMYLLKTRSRAPGKPERLLMR
jgi:acetyl esterase/lipase